MEDKPQIAGHLTQEFTVHLFSFTDCLELFDILRPDQKPSSFLVFRYINFKNRHGGITHPDIPDLHPAARFLHQFLQYIGRTACPLVMDNINQRLITHLVAGPDDTVHFLLHLCITTLDRIKIKA